MQRMLVLAAIAAVAPRAGRGGSGPRRAERPGYSRCEVSVKRRVFVPRRLSVSRTR